MRVYHSYPGAWNISIFTSHGCGEGRMTAVIVIGRSRAGGIESGRSDKMVNVRDEGHLFHPGQLSSPFFGAGSPVAMRRCEGRKGGGAYQGRKILASWEAL